MNESDQPELRASDVDRELVASQLRHHTTAGRLTMSELDQRLQWVYAAKTHGDLAKVVSDLPVASAEPVELAKHGPPGDREQRRAARVSRRGGQAPDRASECSRGVGVAGWGSYLSVNLMLIVIWVLTSMGGGGLGNPWWLWVAGPWGAALIGREIQVRTRRL